MEKACDGPCGPDLYLVISALVIFWLGPGGNTALVWRFARRGGEPVPGAPSGGFAALRGFGAGAPATIEMRGGTSHLGAAPPSGTCCAKATFFCKTTQSSDSARIRIVNPGPGQGAEKDANALAFAADFPLREAGPGTSHRMGLKPARLDFPDRAGRLSPARLLDPYRASLLRFPDTCAPGSKSPSTQRTNVSACRR